MLKQTSSRISVSILMFLSSVIFANQFGPQGNLFVITASGTATALSVQVCLEVTTPWTCENFMVNGQILSIRTVTPGYVYKAAGIKILTPGFSLSGCTLVSNGYCTFTASNTAAATISVGSTATPPTFTSITPNNGTTSGNVGVTLTGTNLTGATAVTFGGTPATSVNVVSATQVTAVTPVHTAGAVDVTITTPLGFVTLTNGYTYTATALGQSSSGGVIGCIGGGLQNLIVAPVRTAILPWGGQGTDIAGAQGTTDGAFNTDAIVTALGNNGGVNYAALTCQNYQVDSLGNTPCQAGNTCYTDWFLPARGQLNCFCTNRVAIGLAYFNSASSLYWASSENLANAANQAWTQDLRNAGTCAEFPFNKDNTNTGGGTSFYATCAQAFTPFP